MYIQHGERPVLYMVTALFGANTEHSKSFCFKDSKLGATKGTYHAYAAKWTGCYEEMGY